MTTASTNDIPTDTAIVILGLAAWINRDLYRTIDFLDAQLEALMSALPRLPRLDRGRRQQLAALAHRIERADWKHMRASSPSAPYAVGTVP
jgi:hypothetical protein